MGEDERLPPLSRRVPDENRGHKPAARVSPLQLPDEVVARMLAAVRAGAAADAALQDPAAPAGAATAQPREQESATPSMAASKGAAAEPADRANRHKLESPRVARKRTAHMARQAEEKRRAEEKRQAEAARDRAAAESARQELAAAAQAKPAVERPKRPRDNEAGATAPETGRASWPPKLGRHRDRDRNRRLDVDLDLHADYDTDEFPAIAPEASGNVRGLRAARTNTAPDRPAQPAASAPAPALPVRTPKSPAQPAASAPAPALPVRTPKSPAQPAAAAPAPALPVRTPQSPAQPSRSPQRPAQAAAAGQAPAKPAESAQAPTQPAQPPQAPAPAKSARTSPAQTPAKPAQAPAAAARQRHVGRHYRLIGAVAAVVVIVLAGVMALVVLKPATGPSASERAQAREAATRRATAAWITSQVSPGTIVSCDATMCRALASHGFLARKLLQLKPGVSPQHSAVIVATADIRKQLGGQLASVDAPVLIARFGSGAQHIDVRTVFPHGAAAYKSALSQDLALRKQTGTQLLSNGRIGVGPGRAGTQMAAGQVDPRLLFTLYNLAVLRPIEIVAFSDGAPGVSANMSPLRSVELQQVPGTAHWPNNLFMNSMRARLRIQPSPYVVSSAQPVRIPGQGWVLRIQFSAPTPLGLLNGSQLSGG